MVIKELEGNDLFKLSKIIKKINLDVKSINTKGKTQTEVGVEIFKGLIENVHLAQDEVNDFLGSLVGCTGKEFGKKKLGEYLSVINALKDIPEIQDFFKAVGQ